METGGAGIPDFGNVLQRRRLLRLFEKRAPGLTVVVAPSGYGKSVLASQFARLQHFSTVVWVSLGDRGGSEEDILAGLSTALIGAGEPPGDASSGVRSMPPDLARTNWMLLIQDHLGGFAGVPVVVVLDGADTVRSLGSLVNLSDLIRSSTCGKSRVIITCRDVDCESAGAASRVWFIEDADLRFSESELKELVAEYLDEGDSMSVADLAELSSGQPALACLMVSHPESAVEGPLSRDLLWYTRRMLAALPIASTGALYIAALLQEGELSELVACTDVPFGQSEWRALSRSMPLLQITPAGTRGAPTFRAHAALREVLVQLAGEVLGEDKAAAHRRTVVARLMEAGDFARVASVLLSTAIREEVRDVLECCGGRVLQAVGPATTCECLDLVSPVAMAGSPRLMLLSAAALRQQERTTEALSHALIARSLAEHTDDQRCVLEASLLIARLALDRGLFTGVKEILAGISWQALRHLSSAERQVMDAYVMLAEAHEGSLSPEAIQPERIRETLNEIEAGSDELVFVANSIGAVLSGCYGRWGDAASTLGIVRGRGGLSPAHRLLLQGNHGAALSEIGEVGTALSMLHGMQDELQRAGLHHLRGYTLGTLAVLYGGLGDMEQSWQCLEESLGLVSGREDWAGAAVCSSGMSPVARAVGDFERSLSLAEEAVRYRDPCDSADMIHLAARIEVAASLLSLGDLSSARREARHVIDTLQSPEAWAHHLKADLVLAECDRCDGESDAGIARLSRYREYVGSGSLNLQIALYCRAFPALLPMLAQAIGTSRIPARLIALLGHECVEEALRLGESIMSADDRGELRRRLKAVKTVVATGMPAPPGGTPDARCHVRLFGGLGVTTEVGEVCDSAWRKRKARSVFVMLVVERGRDIPREVIIERLWSHLEYGNARNNFYVMWSHIKRALACERDLDVSNVYIQNAAGLCRALPTVTSDLDVFDDAIKRMHAAQAVDDSDCVLAAARDLADVYRGELLPGDVYDDWLVDTRERVKQDFCSAMFRAGRYFETREEYEYALEFLRRASHTDPWREDVYQGIMRCSMHSGRRSGAIETFLTCRSRLCEDLGIDPSAETMRLYDAVLAMDVDSGQPYGEVETVMPGRTRFTSG